jgi:hypothetical protein
MADDTPNIKKLPEHVDHPKPGPRSALLAKSHLLTVKKGYS